MQDVGNFPEAARQYRVFIADALAEMALKASSLADYEKAFPLYDESLRLAPRSPGLIIRYAQAALAAHNYARTRTLSEGVIQEYPGNRMATAKAHFLAGQAMMRMNRSDTARTHFEAAVRLDPNFENGYALAVACLDLGDGVQAAKVFDEMIEGLGDTASLRVEIGKAYLNSDFQQLAAPEFQKATEKDGKLPGAHYGLAVVYLTLGGEDSTSMAEHELKAELLLSPNDPSTHIQLGNVALHQQKYAEAEQELKRALVLDPQSPDAFFFLGQVYQSSDRLEEGILAFRRSIALTKDPAYNRFQVQKVHYMLGHLLIQSGRTTEGKQEMALSGALLKLSLNRDRDRLSGESTEETDSAAAASAAALPPDSPAARELADLQMRLGPAIADSYNNLGVIAAGDFNYSDALLSFRRAYLWNPTLEGLDTNWGRAAFLSGNYTEACAPLGRELRRRPEDAEVRTEFAVSSFQTANYQSVLSTLAPMPDVVSATPQLAILQATSLVRTGSVDQGLQQLLALAAANPNSRDVHAALSEAQQQKSGQSHGAGVR